MKKLLIMTALILFLISQSLLVQASEIHNQLVAFTSQAPTGNWSDQRFQDGCEEASSLMAVAWARNQKITKSSALDFIKKSSGFTQKKYGEYRDLSASSTEKWIINDYLNYKKTKIYKNVSREKIVEIIKSGNIIIAPMNGQLLRNPFFTGSGPLHHMLLITGYDNREKTFITNDPGTKRGENYQYAEKILYAALADYPTGYHKKNDLVEKNIIVVYK
ncbi:MAG: C39 family peptidase [bacterium]